MVSSCRFSSSSMIPCSKRLLFSFGSQNHFRSSILLCHLNLFFTRLRLRTTDDGHQYHLWFDCMWPPSTTLRISTARLQCYTSLGFLDTILLTSTLRSIMHHLFVIIQGSTLTITSNKPLSFFLIFTIKRSAIKTPSSRQAFSTN